MKESVTFQSHYRSDFILLLYIILHQIVNFNPIIGLILLRVEYYIGSTYIFQSHYRSDFIAILLHHLSNLLHFNPIIGLILLCNLRDHKYFFQVDFNPIIGLILLSFNADDHQEHYISIPL